jgi:chromosome segregation ATPase
MASYAPAPVVIPPPPRSRLLPVLVGALAVLAGINLYLVLTLKQTVQQASSQQGDQLLSLARRADLGDERYAQLKGQFDVTSERLGMTQQELSRARTLASNIQQQQKTAVDQLNQAIAQKAGTDQLNKVQADADAKITGVSSDLNKNVDSLNKKIGDTNDALNGTKGELSGAIARTHDELVTLAHKTDRDYFEFSLARGKQQKVGSLQARLEKTNTKKNVYTVDLLFDDKRIVRKDQALDSPVFFYMQGAPSTLELVVNKLDKDTASGYVSAPKGFFPNATNVLQSRPGGSSS